MQIVIDISEEDYNNIEPFINGKTIKGGFNLFKALEIIKNGTPLPKGHGKLIDSNVMWDAFQDLGQDFHEAFDFAEANAVIEADEGGE